METLVVSLVHSVGIAIIVFDFNRRLKKLEEKLKKDLPTDNLGRFRGEDGLFKRKKE